MTRIAVTLLIGMWISFNLYAQSSQCLDTYKIARLTGLKGQAYSKEKCYKVFQARKDLQISMSGIRVMPAMGLTSWIEFKKENDDTVVQGNLVLTEDQISPIIDMALKNGIHIISLENHYLWESPKVMFMHIEASGNETTLAKAVGKLFKEMDRTSNGHGNFPLAVMDVEKTSLNPHKVDSILHAQGILKDGVYKVVFHKNVSNENESGLTSWASFAGSDKEALVVGDMATHRAALDHVLLALHKAGFYIVAIHPQVSKDSPMVYLHYLGIGNTKILAKGIHEALSVPIPMILENTNGLNIFPIISYPDETQSLPAIKPIQNNGNFILNLDLSYFNKAKATQPLLKNTASSNASNSANDEVHNRDING